MLLRNQASSTLSFHRWAISDKPRKSHWQKKMERGYESEWVHEWAGDLRMTGILPPCLIMCALLRQQQQTRLGLLQKHWAGEQPIIYLHVRGLSACSLEGKMEMTFYSW